jgi:hypothetical protein
MRREHCAQHRLAALKTLLTSIDKKSMSISMTSRESIAALRAENPAISASEIADRVGLSRERVRQLLLALDLPTKTFAPPRQVTKRSRFYPAKVSCTSTGASAELAVCADLLARGHDVYRSVSHAAKCDIVVASRVTGRMARVEVRCGRTNADGKLVFAAPPDASAYDAIAVLSREGEIRWWPAEGNPVLGLDTP